MQSVVVDPTDRLWILDTGSPLFQRTEYGGPKLVCVDLVTDKVTQKILFPNEVALPTSYLNDVRFNLRQGSAGMAFITDSSDKGPNGIIVVDHATGECWRRLHDHPSTKPEPMQEFLPIVEGRPFVQKQNGKIMPAPSMGSDGIAISADGERLYYCPLGSRRLYSVATSALIDRSRSDAEVAATIVDEGNRGGGSDVLESDAAGCVYATGYEHNAILRRQPASEWETVVHDPACCGRILYPLRRTAISTSLPTNCIGRPVITEDRICGANPTRFFARGSTPSRSRLDRRNRIFRVGVRRLPFFAVSRSTFSGLAFLSLFGNCAPLAASLSYFSTRWSCNVKIPA